MAIITLTTDLGDKDIYLAALKGSIYKLLPTVNIVDVTNSVSAFNILPLSAARYISLSPKSVVKVIIAINFLNIYC